MMVNSTPQEREIRGEVRRRTGRDRETQLVIIATRQLQRPAFFARQHAKKKVVILI